MTRVRMGIVGGGSGSFIGGIHRLAAALDNRVELICGVFSRDEKLNSLAGIQFGLPARRVYKNYSEMFAAEAVVPANQRMQFVAIVTPNHLHFPIAMAALANGFHVLCEKPATLTLEESLALSEKVKETGCLFALAHPYTQYPLVMAARQKVAAGELGEIRKVVVEYHQGWLASKFLDAENKQAEWRVDPDRAGVSCCLGDIGVHAVNLAEYVTGHQIKRVFADLGFVESARRLDDDASVLLRFDNNARGVLLASQISVGEENDLRLRVYGSKGGMEWHQQEPNSLWLKWGDKPSELIRAGTSYLEPFVQQYGRTPAGHPEGFLEAFANIYKKFADRIQSNCPVDGTDDSFPGIDDAVRGMAFIETAVASQAKGIWIELPHLGGQQDVQVSL